MILTFLGTGTSHGVPMIACTCPTCRSTDPRDTRSNASILLTVGAKRILVDCGRDFHVQALREGIEIEPLAVYHGSMEILGYRFGNIAYLSDVSGIPEQSRRKLHGLELLILGALRHTEHPTHFNINQALGVVSELQPKRAFFTHICHDVLHEVVDSQFSDPGSPYYSPIEVHLAYDGLTLEL